MSNTAEEILNKYTKLDIKELSAQDRLNYTIYIGTVLECMEEHTAQRLTTVKEKAEQIKKKCLGLSFDERGDIRSRCKAMFR